MSQCAVFIEVELCIVLLRMLLPTLTFASSNDLAQGRLVPCGRSALREGRIVGGRPAKIGQIPWQLALRRNGVQVCGAAILTESFAVTAAHCIKPHQRIRLQAGSLFLNATGSDVQARDAVEVIVHPLWRKGSWSNDLALLKVDKPFDLDGTVTSPICVKRFKSTPRNPIVVAGWGRTKEGNRRQPYHMHLTSLQPVSNNRCKQRFPYAFSAKEMFCAYGSGGRDTCQGDSGGAAAELIKGVFYLRGLVSWGSGCARPHTPGVYTKIVPHYVDWIRQTVATKGRSQDVAQLEGVSEQGNLPGLPLNSTGHGATTITAPPKVPVTTSIDENTIAGLS